MSCTSVSLPYAHNKSALKYNSRTKTYDYYEFGKVCVDALNKKTPSFKNVIVQEEISAWLSGMGTPEDCAAKIQSRASIWLAENR